MPTLSGNAGGTTASGARVSIRSKNLAESYNVNADSSGDWSVSVSGNAEYAVSAQLAGYTYRNSVNVIVANATVSAVNLKPTLVNAAN